MFYLTVCQGGGIQTPGKCSDRLHQELKHMNLSFLTIFLTLIIIGNSGPSLDQLKTINRDVQCSAFADRTKRNICSMLKSYLDFCRVYKIVGFPASGDDLCLFATWLFVTKKVQSAQSVKNYLSSVRTWHKSNGEDCDTPTSHGPLHLTVRGLERKFSTPVKKMFPITPNILLALIQFPSGIFGTELTMFTVIRALYIHLFLSMLRLDTLVPQSPGCFNPVIQLVWGRVGLLDQGVIIKAIHTKQIQDRRRELNIPLVAKPGSDVCPVAAFQSLTDIPGYPCQPTDPVYNIPGKHGGWVPLGRHQVVTVLEAQIVRLGLDPTMYRPHAFRRGGIQLAAKLVSNFHLLKIHTDHASNAIEAYTNLPAEDRFQVTKSMMEIF